MIKIFSLSLNTFREAIRNKVLYSLLFFAVLLILASMAFGSLSIKEEVRLTYDLGLGGMSLFSVVIAIFVGVNLVYKELERKTIYSLIPKPIHRYQFVLGKYFGMLLTLAVQVAIMTLVLMAVVAVQGGELNSALFKMVALIYLEVMVITAIAVLFSSFSTPLLSGMFTAGIFLVGRSVPEIRALADTLENRNLAFLLDTLSRVTPNLRLFFATGTERGGAYISIHGDFPDWSYVAVASGYAAIYVALALLISMFLFSRRDFI